MTRSWTDERLDEAIERLGRERGLHGALERVARDMGASRHGLQRALKEHRGTSAERIISRSRATGPAPDPVAQHVERKRETKARLDERALVERLHLAEDRVRLLDEISAPMPPANIRKREVSSGLREATAVILASDWHLEEVVEADKVEGTNAYNVAIGEERAGRFFGAIEWLLGHHRQAWQIRDVCLWLGGDLISGYIHEELVESNELSPTEAILTLRRILGAGIRRLLQDPKIERIVVPCNYGNHGRTTQKPRISTGAENSFEWLLYHVLASDFALEPRVRFQIARGEHMYVEAYGFTLHFTHGDSVNYQGGVGGIAIPLQKAVDAWNTVRRADLHHVGHFHQALHGRDWVANGSLIGYGPYSWRVRARYEEPKQQFYLLDSKRGRCQMTPIWVTESEKAA